MAHHTWTYRVLWRADLIEEFAVLRIGNAPKHTVTDTGLRFRNLVNHNAELLCGVIFCKCWFQREA